MKQQDHLTVYDLTLRTRSPLFIGSGQQYSRTDYVFSPETRKASILDREKLFEYLAERGKIDQYEAFIMGGGKDMNSFLFNACGATAREIDRLTHYSMDASSALDERHSLKDIHAFVRDAQGRAYIPGSSLKGAIRTLLLFDLIQKKGKKETSKGEINEGAYLHTLKCKLDREGNIANDPVNSIMRGISISDSLPILDECMTLGAKMDADVYGDIRKINVCRECVAPDTEVRFTLTLDQSVLHGSITPEFLYRCIDQYDDYYWDTYVHEFGKVQDECGEDYRNCLILGGGAGFFAKSLAYPFYGKETALRVVSNYLASVKSFSKHGHDKDVKLGISPHMMKYAEYQGKMYPYGVCEVEFE